MQLQNITVNGEKIPQDHKHGKNAWLWTLLFRMRLQVKG